MSWSDCRQRSQPPAAGPQLGQPSKITQWLFAPIWRRRRRGVGSGGGGAAVAAAVAAAARRRQQWRQQRRQQRWQQRRPGGGSAARVAAMAITHGGGRAGRRTLFRLKPSMRPRLFPKSRWMSTCARTPRAGLAQRRVAMRAQRGALPRHHLHARARAEVLVGVELAVARADEQRRIDLATRPARVSTAARKHQHGGTSARPCAGARWGVQSSARSWAARRTCCCSTKFVRPLVVRLAQPRHGVRCGEVR